jgi:hypothetical protein
MEIVQHLHDMGLELVNRCLLDVVLPHIQPALDHPAFVEQDRVRLRALVVVEVAAAAAAVMAVAVMAGAAAAAVAAVAVAVVV